jgi:hypothetical protein
MVLEKNPLENENIGNVSAGSFRRDAAQYVDALIKGIEELEKHLETPDPSWKDLKELAKREKNPVKIHFMYYSFIESLYIARNEEPPKIQIRVGGVTKVYDSCEDYLKDLPSLLKG